MKIFYILITALFLLACSSNLAETSVETISSTKSEEIDTGLNPKLMPGEKPALSSLYGTWRKGTESENVQIIFKEQSIVMFNGEESMEFKVRYVDLEKTWVIEILTEEGEEQATLFATFSDINTISCGQPGLPFLTYKRVQ